ncbi:ABC-type transport auxiliary lipoprotein family protein [Propionivibrio dicarboxylicus]|uniref:Cholesterol transport system auxiliary component n=1 Tax=Propionivibrio dicarboxylicus TaxID=83767 RepID=A0A1G8LSR6_9RHOO|nr:ABC-type transport auxiliary lipoprotein family protein [Propionivibrio dicarboxylicus]SDI58742.1 cholesterol transport system auxiliary component [Propionivibrio dicarboxylicus]
MRRVRYVLAGGWILLLSACAVGSRQLPPSAVYDFGLAGAAGADGGAWVGIALEVRTPPWFDALSIDYRLNYDDPLRPREYADSRWAANPGGLIAQRLRQSLGFPAAGATSVCLLRIDVQEFSHVFDAPTVSRGVLQGSMTLVDGKRRVVAERRLFVERAATRSDARGGVEALVRTVSGFQEELAAWSQALGSNPDARGCFSRSPPK